MIDAHVHLDFYDNQTKIIEDIIKEDINTVFVTHLPELFARYVELYKDVPQLILAVGFHPVLINEYDFNERLFLESLKVTKFIGEVGLDFSVARSENSREKQQLVFNKICQHSNNHILSLHSRQAAKEVFDTITKNNVERAIFHWYTGDKELIGDILDAGYYFSINPAMLNTNKGRSILRSIPINKVLIESDGPFTKYKGSVIEPINMRSIYKTFEEFYNLNNLEDIVFENMLSILE